MQREHRSHLCLSLKSIRTIRQLSGPLYVAIRDCFSKIRHVRDGSDTGQTLLDYLLQSLLRELAAVIHCRKHVRKWGQGVQLIQCELANSDLTRLR